MARPRNSHKAKTIKATSSSAPESATSVLDRLSPNASTILLRFLLDQDPQLRPVAEQQLNPIFAERTPEWSDMLRQALADCLDKRNP